MEVIIVGGFLLGGLIPAFIAKSKGRSFFAWFIYGAFLWFSIIPFIHVLLIKPNEYAAGMKKCVNCASVIRQEAKICPACRTSFEVSESEVTSIPKAMQVEGNLFSGERDLISPSYQLFLARRFNIERNATLERYVIEDEVFATLDESLQEADLRYSNQLALIKERDELAHRQALLEKEKAEVERVQMEEREAIKRAEQLDHDAKLAVARAKQIKYTVIATVAAGLTVIALIAAYGFWKGAQESRREAERINEEAMRFQEMYAKGSFFGLEVGANNFSELSRKISLDRENSSVGHEVFTCESSQCNGLAADGKIDSNIQKISFIYCRLEPNRKGGSLVSKTSSDNLLLSGVSIFFQSQAVNKLIFDELRRSGLSESTNVSDVVQELSLSASGVLLLRRRTENGVIDLCGSK